MGRVTGAARRPLIFEEGYTLMRDRRRYGHGVTLAVVHSCSKRAGLGPCVVFVA